MICKLNLFYTYNIIINLNWLFDYLVMSAYDDLMCILHHPDFRSEHVVENVQRLRLLCN